MGGLSVAIPNAVEIYGYKFKETPGKVIDESVAMVT